MPAGFYAYVEPDPDLADVYVGLRRVILAFERKGRFKDAARARAVLGELIDGYGVLSRLAPGKADAFIRDVIRQKQVRPPTSGRLWDSIHSVAPPAALPNAAVNIASLAVLDAGAVNPVDKVAYWRAQEYGLPALSPSDYGGGGRRVATGYFTNPGVARPNQGDFRVHAYFQRSSGKGTPALMRLRAVQPKRFLATGTARFIRWHDLQSQRIVDTALSNLPRA